MITKTQFEDRIMNGTYKVGGGGGFSIEERFEIKPDEFLNFAEEDLKEGSSRRNLVNALSNVKRALDCQIDLLIYDFAYLGTAKKERWNFPKKLEFLNDQNILAPRILKKINGIRNLLEHEFKEPKLSEVEDAIDVVTLFINYTQRLSGIPEKISLYREINTPKYHSLRYSYSLEFDKDNRIFTVIDTKGRIIFTIEDNDKSFKLIMEQTRRLF